MLDDLDRIPWENLRTAYGPAPEVPELILSLTSDDPEEWDEALFTLEMGILHQDCDVTDATAAAIPFLVEVAAEPTCDSRVHVLYFIGRAASIAVNQALGVQQNALERILSPNEFAEMREFFAASRRWGTDTFLNVVAELDDFIRLMGDSSSAVRLYACWVVARMVTTDASMLAPAGSADVHAKLSTAIKSLYPEERVDAVRAGMLFAFEMLVDAGAAPITELSSICPQPTEPAETTAWALIVARKSEDISGEVVSFLTGACRDPQATEAAFTPKMFGTDRKHNRMAREFHKLTGERDLPYPWFENSLLGILSTEVSKLASKSPDAVPAVVSLLKAYDRGSLPKSLFEIVFPGLELPAGSQFSDLNTFQQDTLRNLFANRRFWVNAGIQVHDESRLSGHARTFLKGMPADRKAMARYIGIENHFDTALDLLIAAAFPWIEDDGDLTNVERCARVGSLDLRGIPTSEALRLLNYFPNLRTLTLDESVSENDIPALRKLSGLEKLIIPGTRLSPDKIARLKHALERVRISIR